MFPPTKLPLPQEVLLITDELLAPADFLLHRQLAAHMKESKDSRCVLISVSEDLGRWKSVAQRSNLNLAQSLDLQSLAFIDAMSHVSPALDESSRTPLKALYMNVLEHLKRSHLDEAKALVVLDDIAALEWIGVPLVDILRFARALCATCRKYNASLIIRHHITTPGEPDDILRNLLQLCTYHMDVFPLSTGRSGSVSGQVALHCGAATSEPTHKLIPRSTAIQYRLTDTGSVFFDRGTGSGVL
ncbi:hypothetical protein C8Q70DRAFT_971176 [Cubamyces menziesii]|nr:hypothetical protein C8Q70DRAFT_971176 [Cubamyces menziesii]